MASHCFHLKILSADYLTHFLQSKLRSTKIIWLAYNTRVVAEREYTPLHQTSVPQYIILFVTFLTICFHL